MPTGKCSFVTAPLFLGALAASCPAFTANGSDVFDRKVIEAVWKPQRLLFDYRSEGRLYRCDILEYKIEMILRRLGAGERLELRPVRCRDLDTRARFEVLMESPVAATADNVRDITSHYSHDELVARLRRIPLASATDLERFPAIWESISFRRDRRLHLQAGDCALVQQLRRQILPKLSVRVMRDIDGTDCSQELSGISSPPLTVLALVTLRPSKSSPPRR